MLRHFDFIKTVRISILLWANMKFGLVHDANGGAFINEANIFNNSGWMYKYLVATGSLAIARDLCRSTFIVF